MIRYTTYLACALLTTSVAAVYAQDENPHSSASDPEALPPSEFVPEGQVVPVADEGIDDVVEGDDYAIPLATPEDELNAEFEVSVGIVVKRAMSGFDLCKLLIEPRDAVLDGFGLVFQPDVVLYESRDFLMTHRQGT